MGQGVKRVWEVCEPNPDVYSRDMDLSLFAISLFHVVQGTADRDYTDPERFFSRTFMTRALENLLERVVGRLGGLERGAPILRLETPFGGGKTHTMTALFHIARFPEVLSEHEAVKQILARLNLRALPSGVRVAVLDGRGLAARERHTEDGLLLRTLWGELAYQLGGKEGYTTLKEADETRTAPGAARLTALLEQFQPALILIDEVLEYLIKARAMKVGDSNLMEQTAVFLGELTAAVSAVPRSVLVVALPASSLEVPTESSETVERLFQHVKKVFGRTELVETPVAQDEVFGVLRRRLFQTVGHEREQKRAVEAMLAYYARYARFFPDRLRSPTYKNRMLQAYPFHPELIDLLYERWGPHPQFQRTRGALRLLALVLRRLWNQRPGSALLIQPHHLDLSDRHIRAEVVRLPDGGMDAVVTGDILQRAVEIERQLGGEYAKEQVGRGAATCVFLYSISAATQNAGATEEEIRTALLRPDLNPAMATEVLGRLREELWYLRYRDRRYLFTTKPNLNKLILDFETEVSDERVEHTLREWLARVAGKGEEIFQVVLAPEDPTLVPDRAKPTLVLLPLDVSDPHAWMEKALHAAGDGIRTNKNMLVFLVPDKQQAAHLRASIKRWCALREVERSSSFREMERDDQDLVRQQLKDKETEIESLFRQIYQSLYRPAAEGLRLVQAGFPTAIKAKTLSEFVASVLEKQAVLLERIDPRYLIEVLGAREEEVPIAQVKNLLTATPGQPMVKDPAQILKSLQQGVEQGDFGIRVGGKTYIRERVPEEVLRDNTGVLVPLQEPTPPPQQPPQKPLTLLVQTSTSMLYPLLQAAKLLTELNQATVELRVSDPTGRIATKREELDKLLQDYGCTVAWMEREEGRAE